MTDDPDIEDLAVLYVLGELSSDERASFQQRLDGSAELRNLVHDLQAGTEAMARAVPQVPLPTDGWSDIEAAIEADRKVVAVSFRRKLSWIAMAAAACVVGLLVLSWNRDKSGSPPIASAPTSPATKPDAVPNRAPSIAVETPSAFDRGPIRAPSISPLAGDTNLPAETLDKRIAALESEMNRISQTLTQRTVAGNVGLDGIRFFQPAGQAAGLASLSPEMQRALVLALARELARQQPGGDGMPESISKAEDNGLGVDFVDLFPSARGQSQTNTPSEIRTPPDPLRSESSSPDSMALDQSAAPNVGLVGFYSGDHTILIVEASAVPSGYDFITLTGYSQSGTVTFQNSVLLGGYPLIVSVPLDATTLDGGSLALSAGSTLRLGDTPLNLRAWPTISTNAP